MFPEELPKRLIKMFSFVGDTILDPFLGSGTTSFAAKNLSRNSVGYEINSEFIHVIKNKLGVHQTDIHGTEYQFINQNQKSINIDYPSEIKLLPYIFKDPHALDKKIDPKKLQFGSKIDKNGSSKREELFKVKYVESVKTIVLENDLKVNLIGIDPYPFNWRILGENVNYEGIKFLEDKFKNSKIFLKFDQEKYDNDGNLYGYVYLENKTFINAHLLKNGFAHVDTKNKYVHFNKFSKIVQEREIVIKNELKEYRIVY